MSPSRFELVAAMPSEAAKRLPSTLGLTVLMDGPCALVLLPAQASAGLRALVSRKGPTLAGRLVARQRLLEALLDAGDVLPARPGQWLRAELLRPALAAGGAALSDALAALAGRAQFQVLIRWAASGALARFASEPELTDCADALALAFGAEALRARLGAEFARRLSLAPSTTCPCRSSPAGDADQRRRPAASPRHRRPRAELEAIDALWPEGLSIKLVGPCAPVSFAAFELASPGPDAREARRRLGLGALAGEPEIRAALRGRALDGRGAAEGAALTEAAELLRRLARGRARWRRGALSSPATTCPCCASFARARRPPPALAPQPRNRGMTDGASFWMIHGVVRASAPARDAPDHVRAVFAGSRRCCSPGPCADQRDPSGAATTGPLEAEAAAAIAHNLLLTAYAMETDVAPVRYGAAVLGPDAACALLAPEAARYEAVLARVGGGVEYALRLTGGPRPPPSRRRPPPAAPISPPSARGATPATRSGPPAPPASPPSPPRPRRRRARSSRRRRGPTACSTSRCWSRAAPSRRWRRPPPRWHAQAARCGVTLALVGPWPPYSFTQAGAESARAPG
jgi:hypothetical protein